MKVVIGINIRKAGILIKPTLNGKFTFKNDPDIKKPIAPNNAIIKPIAEALPIALFIEYPKYFNIGTFMTAPPIPIGAEIKPDKNPNITLGNMEKLTLIPSSLSLRNKR